MAPLSLQTTKKARLLWFDGQQHSDLCLGGKQAAVERALAASVESGGQGPCLSYLHSGVQKQNGAASLRSWKI